MEPGHADYDPVYVAATFLDPGLAEVLTDRDNLHARRYLQKETLEYHREHCATAVAASAIIDPGEGTSRGSGSGSTSDSQADSSSSDTMSQPQNSRLSFFDCLPRPNKRPEGASGVIQSFKSKFQDYMKELSSESFCASAAVIADPLDFWMLQGKSSTFKTTLALYGSQHLGCPCD